MTGNFVAGDGEDQRFTIAFAGDGDLYDGALGTFEHVGDIAGGEAIGGLVIHLDDYVARANAGVVGRCADVRSHDYGVVFARSNDHADAVVFAALIFAEEGKLTSV